MQRRYNLLLFLLICIVFSRMVTMATMPLVDTTEPRYAEIARIMSETGDWITPWFSDGVPFWGKPPLSFWMEALSFRLFGVNEFAARLPSWLAHLVTLGLIFTLLRNLSGYRQALTGALIYSSMALPFLLSGAVLTDPFLALGTTLSFVSFILALKNPGSYWRWWIFIGLSIGLLAKGPLMLVLTGGPLFLWTLWRRQWRDLCVIPWVRGMILAALLSLPWYIAAEIKTPGFLVYFIIGEHFLRFIDSGWSGDLYGSAHKHMYGTIWLYWVAASFPWGLIAIIVTIWKWISSNSLPWKPSDEQRLMITMAIFPSLFFTFAGNILATYQLPALAPLSMLIAINLPESATVTIIRATVKITVLVFIPLTLAATGIYAYNNNDKLDTEKILISRYQELKGDNNYPLIYLGKAPFSARFYSKGSIKQLELTELQVLSKARMYRIYFLAVPDTTAKKILSSLQGTIKNILQSNHYILLQVKPAEDSVTTYKPKY